MSEERHSLSRLWRMLDAEQRMAGIGALGIIASLFMPWWRDPYPPKLSHAAINRFTWIELSLLLVATAVLLLLARRAQGRVFHLPLSDGLLAMGAGLWCSVLVVTRVVDPPTQAVGANRFDCDVRFGFAVCLAASAVLALAGLRARRRYHRGEPEAVAADADAEPTVPMAGS